MKKFSIIAATMLLVLAVGQNVFAKGNVSVNAELLKTGFNQHIGYEGLKGYNLGISVEHELTNEISISGKFSVSKIKFEEENYYSIAPLFFVSEIYIKYNVFNRENINIGIQFGLSDIFSKLTYDELQKEVHNFLYAGVGIYANAYILPGLQVYTDLKVPVALLATNTITYGEDEHYERTLVGTPIASKNAAFIDLSLGINYDIQPNVFFGIEGRISNLGPVNYESYFSEYHYPYHMAPSLLWTYSIGAKLGFLY